MEQKEYLRGNHRDLWGEKSMDTGGMEIGGEYAKKNERQKNANMQIL